MIFPSTDDFLASFGIEPVEEDPSMAYCRYVKKSCGEDFELDFSFSAVAESFQIDLRFKGCVVATVSSEKVKSIELWHDNTGSGVHVIFDMNEVSSEAWVKLEPEVSCRWWALRSA